MRAPSKDSASASEGVVTRQSVCTDVSKRRLTIVSKGKVSGADAGPTWRSAECVCMCVCVCICVCMCVRMSAHVCVCMCVCTHFAKIACAVSSMFLDASLSV